MKKLMFMLIFIRAISIFLYAATNSNLNVGGSVPDRINLIKLEEHLALPGNIDEGVSDHLLSIYNVENNNRAGYTLTIDSNNTAAKGFLLASLTKTPPDPGDKIDYTIDIVDNNTSPPYHWGQTFPAITAAELAISSVLNFNSSSKATYLGSFKIVMDVKPNTGAYEDTYSDIISINLADI